jgi:hypothetical protein
VSVAVNGGDQGSKEAPARKKNAKKEQG